ncbi:conserved hypothetical protein [Vibrio nigripulchritudo MADA3029]|uniref:Uncharacterized protein n=1 Tax=Vibrio nigripulchritudo TaxID=28173 RepID=U4KHF2_9VIBR|nr:hypothetical protein [Vibrio nigripulchritudo]CCN48936.1 conserved hypothetical protein [Vibrio nigripulchritudo MADA3020]CCN53222.1 conserved hypothetical protein [Vibrio nigripulchritudo MADA3021]CCN56824.1 conserved hypothetical protein [Vibrio nigripulchritudo MADA3029]CCN85481.1 conserved hypothetical protein [Vibrio nigripulchritudo BLFn1]CCN89050.1 conserved hypothetical protein [Vibrio nigripulchritudo SFn27]
MFDDLGESLTGITDAITSGTKDYVSAWFDNESDKVKSAAPEEQRPTYVPPQQPNGRPVEYRQGVTLSTTHLLIGLAIIGGALILAKRG